MKIFEKIYSRAPERMTKLRIALLTTHNWEGVVVTDALLKAGIQINSLIIQDIWWDKLVIRGYSPRYWARIFLDRLFGVFGRSYDTLWNICERYNLKPLLVANINDELERLKVISPDLIVVVGSRIIKKRILDTFNGRIINFHTGILPEYRGPYSEFWAMYNQDIGNIGTTIHLLDEGIDTGAIIGQRKLEESFDTPESCHRKNVIMGSRLLIDCILGIERNGIHSIAQDNSKACYFTYPSGEEILVLEKRIGKKINIDYAE